MYYFKTYYDNGTWDILKSETFIQNPRAEVCATCHTCGIISAWLYHWLAFKGWLYGLFH